MKDVYALLNISPGARCLWSGYRFQWPESKGVENLKVIDKDVTRDSLFIGRKVCEGGGNYYWWCSPHKKTHLRSIYGIEILTSDVQLLTPLMRYEAIEPLLEY